MLFGGNHHLAFQLDQAIEVSLPINYAGARNHVVDPVMQVNRPARPAKTDSIDVVQLLRSLMAYPRGEPKVWSAAGVKRIAPIKR